MDDASSPWLRLALCPKIPTDLLRELLHAAALSPIDVTDALAHWLHPNAAGTEPTLALPDDFLPSASAWKILARQLTSRAVDTAVTRSIHWAAQSNDRYLLTPEHPNWPSQLLALRDPPSLLYAIGDPAILIHDQISMVGARQSSIDGKRTASKLSRDLATKGWVITSGLALGIDTEAHLGCLDGGSPTIAVMATHADECYPRANQALANQIVTHGGCLITETSLGTPLKRYLFPRRNRLIAALSQGVVVVEAALRSGTITTAQHAATQGREVMAVPGSVRNPLVTGCHQLIRDGANLVTSAEDVVECVGVCRNRLDRQKTGKSPVMQPQLELENPSLDDLHGSSSELATTLLDAMGYDPAPLDRLIRHTGMSAAELVTLLTQLELQGKISRDFAGRYSRC